MEKPIEKTDIFRFGDYREYLAAYYEERKRANPGFSHRVFARQAGLSSPSHLLMIIKGERNLSLKTIAKFVDGLKLGAREKKYFELLVLFNQTDDMQMKARYFSEIMQLKGALKGLHALEKERFEFLSKWHLVAIYVLVDLEDFAQAKADPVWIARRLGGRITPAQAKEALAKLAHLGLIERVPEGESPRVYRQVSGALTVADDTRSMAVFNYHQSMIKLAYESLRRDPASLREMNGATISIPIEKLPELKERIRAFRKEINQLASGFTDAGEIYQLNIQLFPLTQVDPGKAQGKPEKK